MTFKNINTYHKHLVGRIAGQQHSAWGIRNVSDERSVYSTPLEFEIWFQKGLNYYTSKGYKFQWLNLTTLKVTLPDGRKGTRTIEDFEDEYNNEYKRQFPNCQ